MEKIKSLFNWKISELFIVIFGSFLTCFAVNIFIVPNSLFNGGVLGISQLIRSFVVNTLNINITFNFSGILYYLINIPLFFIAYKNINKTFFARTLFAVSIQSLMLSLIPSPSKPIVNDIFANVVVGGILGGVGSGITLSCGASGGGSDIIGIYLSKKYNNFSVGKFGLGLNVIIYSITGFLHGVSTMIYSVIYSAVSSVAVDKLHIQNISTTAFVFCKKNPKIINNYIKNELKRDFTYWHAFGGYDDSKTYIIYTALSKYELNKLERYIKTIDDHIFIVKNEGVGINGIFQKNF